MNPVNPLIERSTTMIRRGGELAVQVRQRFPFLVNAGIMLVVLGVLFGIGSWLRIRTKYFDFVFVPVALSLALPWIYSLDRSLARRQHSTSSPLMKWTYWAGMTFLFIAYILGVLYIARRIPLDPDTSRLFFWAVFSVVALAGLWYFVRILTDGDVTRLDVARIGIMTWSLMIGWVVGSLAYSPLGLFESPLPVDDRSADQVYQERRNALRPDVKVAVALSGGGYRAATIHAGVLEVLEGGRSTGSAKIPIDYLTTVSGGSIIGSFYALGHSAGEFSDLLKRQKPGMPNDLFHFTAFFCEALCASYADSDTYSSHFNRVYFPNKRLGDVQTPTLIVNATNYEKRKREIFSSDHPSHKALLVADVVAASGAFPGAFEPKRIDVPNPATPQKPRTQYYIDGGVVENLGLEGLRDYFAAAMAQSEKPDVIIISDASKADKPPAIGTKAFRFTLLEEASSTSYAALHRKLYRLFTNNHYDPEQSNAPVQPFFQAKNHVFSPTDAHTDFAFVFVLDGTSDAELDDMAGWDQPGCNKTRGRSDATPKKSKCRAVKVAEIGTLNELSQEEVDMGVWVGQTIAGKYSDAIACVIEKIKGLKAVPTQQERAALEVQTICSAKVRRPGAR